ncbi:MAG: hypothetical protein QOJ15_10733 [Bradyrhizobium sp.]|jgi:hypothetical protein|nr:hypothetical protein [Bradyrhizobium sp.]
MTRAFGAKKAAALLALIAGYLILNYPFMQLRVPPAGFGIPLGELLLIVVLFSSNIPTVLARMNATVLLAPFLLWWVWALGRLVFDAAEYGFWAFRDATQSVESLFLVAGFTLAGRRRSVELFERWLGPIMAVACLYGLLFVYANEITAASPTLPGASEQPIPIFGAFATTGTMLLWGAFYCLTRPATSPAVRLRYDLVGGFLVAFAILVIQARTTYFQIIGLAALLWFAQPATLGRLSLAIPILVALLAVISAFDIRVSGRLSSELSFSFFWDHILSIFGIRSGGHDGLSEAADGVALRMGWWKRLYDQLTADPATLLAGLGFGIPLTDFRDPLGVVAREPHNSLISVAARLGLIGILCWLWMQFELFRVGVQAYRDCRRRSLKESDLVLLVLAFAVLTLASCFGEDTMEKPYNAVPYYAFWGFALRVAYQVRREPGRQARRTAYADGGMGMAP